MIFIETPIFTYDVKEYLDDEEYRALQVYLAEYPEAGSLLEGTGGLRKIRWAAKGKGKRGGVRAIYYYVVAAQQIRMILIYKKGIMDTLTDRQKAQLCEINKGWK
ncbi:hypothetical protein [Pseudomonas amygdali]